MFGWAIASGKKIVAIVIAFALIYSIGTNYYSKQILDLFFLSFLVGMLLPDIDVLTNFLKKFIHSFAIFLFVFGAILVAFYPASVSVSNNLCLSITSEVDKGITTYCNVFFLGLFLVVFYIVARMIVGFVPSENFMHSYLMLIIFAFAGYVFLIFLFEQEMVIFLDAIFFCAYFIHLAIDASYHYHKN
ncbi:MAG: hypothetical protein ACK4J0_02430 [Candidatus Anstonellaceae archaeon]